MFVCCREEKTEQLLDCRQELDNMETEWKRLQQEVSIRHHSSTENMELSLISLTSSVMITVILLTTYMSQV